MTLHPDAYTLHPDEAMAYEKLMVFTARAILFVVLVEVAYGKETLRLGALVSSRQAGTRFDQTGFLLPLELALETINNDSTLQYTFEVTISNSMVIPLVQCCHY